MDQDASSSGSPRLAGLGLPYGAQRAEAAMQTYWCKLIPQTFHLRGTPLPKLSMVSMPTAKAAAEDDILDTEVQSLLRRAESRLCVKGSPSPAPTSK